MGISEMTQSSAVKGIFYININFMTDLLVKIRNPVDSIFLQS